MGRTGLDGRESRLGGGLCGATVPDFRSGLPLIEGLKPDRSFDTIACGGAKGSSEGFGARFAALVGGSACAVFEPGAARLLGTTAARGCCACGVPAQLASGCGPSDGGLPGACLVETLAVGEDGRVHVAPLRALLAPPEADGRLKVVLNGAAGPYLCRPLRMGADVVVEDARSWMPPSVLSACGLAEDGEPCLVAAWTGKKAGDALAALAPRAFRRLDGPQDALLAAGLETLSMRAQRASDNALVAAHYLVADERIAWVSYPGLPDDGANDAARRTFEHGFGPLVAFGLAAGPATQVAADGLPAEGGAVKGGARSGVRPGPLPASFVLHAGLESPLDIVASLERFLAGPPEGAGAWRPSGAGDGNMVLPGRKTALMRPTAEGVGVES